MAGADEFDEHAGHRLVGRVGYLEPEVDALEGLEVIFGGGHPEVMGGGEVVLGEQFIVAFDEEAVAMPGLEGVVGIVVEQRRQGVEAFAGPFQTLDDGGRRAGRSAGGEGGGGRHEGLDFMGDGIEIRGWAGQSADLGDADDVTFGAAGDLRHGKEGVGGGDESEADFGGDGLAEFDERGAGAKERGAWGGLEVGNLTGVGADFAEEILEVTDLILDGCVWGDRGSE